MEYSSRADNRSYERGAESAGSPEISGVPGLDSGRIRVSGVSAPGQTAANRKGLSDDTLQSEFSTHQVVQAWDHLRGAEPRQWETLRWADHKR